MEIIVEKGCGLDVHKETVVACIMGTGIKKEIRTYLTVTNDLLRLKEWLRETGITHVAMEKRRYKHGLIFRGNHRNDLPK